MGRAVPCAMQAGDHIFECYFVPNKIANYSQTEKDALALV